MLNAGQGPWGGAEGQLVTGMGEAGGVCAAPGAGWPDKPVWSLAPVPGSSSEPCEGGDAGTQAVFVP